jgi:site-specific recombinase XerD
MSYNDTHKISELINQFILDRRASGKALGTIRFYIQKLAHFQAYLDNKKILTIDQIKPDDIRIFLLDFQEDHSQGGTHAVFRSVHAFLNWYEAEFDPDNWKNPIRNIKAPKVDENILDPVSEETIEIMLSVCRLNSEYGRRDKAIILFLYQTGVRASELLRLDRSDIDLNTNTALIRKSKNKHYRYVFFDRDCKKALVNYLKIRKDNSQVLWINKYDERLRYDGLRGILTARGKEAGINPPTAHSFRRAFAIGRLRADVPEYTLIHLMGQTSINALRPYLKQDINDLRKAAFQSKREEE